MGLAGPAEASTELAFRNHTLTACVCSRRAPSWPFPLIREGARARCGSNRASEAGSGSPVAACGAVTQRWQRRRCRCLGRQKPCSSVAFSR